MFRLLLVCLFSLPGHLLLAQPEWNVVSGDITFEIQNAGITVDGSIGNLQGDIRFDASDLTPANLRASVGVKTLETGISARDHHLMSKKYFWVDQYPRITMRSVEIRQRSGSSFEGTFELTIRGETRTVTFPFTFQRDDKAGIFDGEFSINRLDYGVGGKSLFLGDEVQVSIRVRVVPAQTSLSGNSP